MNNTPFLPQGVSKATFATAIKEYRSIVGEEHVIVDMERLAPYRRLMIPEDIRLHEPCGSISPVTVEQIQAIIAVSNKYRIPIWSISTGRNFGYGEAAPATPGQMILDLRRMNRIIDVDSDMATALVEPGVTYQQLHDYISERNLPLWLNYPSPAPIVSAVGNTLERGMGYTRYQEQAQHFCGLEAVMADGTVVKTAMGGVKGNTTWQAYRWGYGPWLDGLFCQSNFGIVTKMGMWLMRKPVTQKPYVIGFSDLVSAARAMDVMRELRLNTVIENGVMVHVSYGVAMKMPREKIYPGPGPVPDQVWEGFCKATGTPLWAAAGTLYGTPEQVAANWNIVRSAYQAVGGEPITEENASGGASVVLDFIKNLMTNQMSLEDFGLFNYRGGGIAWYAPVVPTRGSDALKCATICKSVLEEFGFDYIGGFMMGYSGRHCDAAIALTFDRNNPEEMKRAYECSDKLISITAEAGYALYRASTAFMKKTAEVYGPEQSHINRQIKRALDPKGILSPGKSGIYL